MAGSHDDGQQRWLEGKGIGLVRRRHADQCSRCRASPAGLVIKLVSRLAISLRVSGICPSGLGLRVCSMAAATVRKAAASMVRVTQRCQDVQVRTW
jgi:hypothetical protein